MSKPMSPVSGAARIFDLSLGELIWSRRTIFMALVVGAPVVLATVARIVQASGVAPLRVNGVPTEKSIEEIGGTTSTGEFGSTLLYLFKPESEAIFKAAGSEKLGLRPAVIYDFKVSKAKSYSAYWRER